MVITVSEEKVVDYELTARIATEAFGSRDVTLLRLVQWRDLESEKPDMRFGRFSADRF
jgi:hypothetical protein